MPFRLFVLLFLSTVGAVASQLPERESRGARLIDLNTPREFPTLRGQDDWRARARQIREQALVSCGLMPMPAKTPLNAVISGRIEREGYSIENVYIETLPGFFLAGNLYRPTASPGRVFPGILNPHGHWEKGRFTDTADGSAAARCINFARQGMVAFSYDMVGYNDTSQLVHRQSFLNPTNQLWHISMMGLQTWNSIRALDFLASLPDVDPNKLACTGESGGGTQTFMLGAIDPRLAVQAPIVMVSHIMQGGCVCENAPGLRVDHSNMEIAAAPAPRPQMIVSATGDWTKDTMKVEGPAIESVYKLFGAGSQFEYLVYEAPHNYNQQTREAVYGWFAKWLKGDADAHPRAESPYKKEPDEALRVFPDGKLPQGALTENALGEYFVARAQRMWREAAPVDAATLSRYKSQYGPLWERSLLLQRPSRRELLIEKQVAVRHDGYHSTRMALGRMGAGDRLDCLLFSPLRGARARVAILVSDKGSKQFHDGSDQPTGFARDLVDAGVSVLCVNSFGTGAPANGRNYFTNFFTGYNRTDLQERVQDIATAAAAARSLLGYQTVLLAGQGRAGLWSILAAPFVDGLAVDADSIGRVTDEELLAHDLFSPGLRAFGDFEGAAMLALPTPIYIHNTGSDFASSHLKAAADGVGAKLVLKEKSAEGAQLASWLAELE